MKWDIAKNQIEYCTQSKKVHAAAEQPYSIKVTQRSRVSAHRAKKFEIFQRIVEICKIQIKLWKLDSLIRLMSVVPTQNSCLVAQIQKLNFFECKKTQNCNLVQRIVHTFEKNFKQILVMISRNKTSSHTE